MRLPRSVHYIRGLKSLYRIIAFNILPICLLILLFASFIPWQQTIFGTGIVSAYNPDNRPQSIEAPFDGRIQKWYFREGDYIRKGDILLDIGELDKEFLSPNLDNLTEKLYQAELRNQDAYQDRLAALRAAISNLTINFRNQISEQKSHIEILHKNQEVAEINFNRHKELYNKGLISQREYELTLREKNKTDNELEQSKINLSTLQSRLNTEKSKLQAELASIQSLIANSQARLSDITIRRETVTSRMSQRSIVSPIDGYLVQVIQFGEGTNVKANQIIATIVPEVQDQAVELNIRDIDAIFVRKGDTVRIQFAGWPTVHIPGFSKAINVGTFGGVVQVIDQATNQPGSFRIIVVPDPQDEKKWPSALYLKPGIRASGWVILQTVPLGYEIWRNLNGFPVLLPDRLSENNELPRVPLKIRGK